MVGGLPANVATEAPLIDSTYGDFVSPDQIPDDGPLGITVDADIPVATYSGLGETSGEDPLVGFDSENILGATQGGSHNLLAYHPLTGAWIHPTEISNGIFPEDPPPTPYSIAGATFEDTVNPRDTLLRADMF